MKSFPESNTPAPIVLVHGLSGLDRLFNRRRPSKEYFPGVRPFLEAQGYRVFIPRVSATASIATRAAQLKVYLAREVGSQPIHLIGHSMGGLDSRYLITHLGLDSQVLSLTTIGCPHWGSTFADWSISRFARYFHPLFRAAGICDDAFFDLTTEACQRFNERTPDAPTVRYASIAGVIEKQWMSHGWRLPSRIVRNLEGLNDGIVSVASATWGERTDIWAGDHLNLVNWPNRRMTKAGEWPNRVAQYGVLVQRLSNIVPIAR